MQKFKRFMGVALAATMVVGTSMTAFAEDPVTSGSTTGAGTSEGSVDKHVINVVLPTIAEGSTPFAYTMDAERLIQETEGAKYSDATFPAADTDTGVYFLTGETTGTTTKTYEKVETEPDDYLGTTAFGDLAQTCTEEEYAALEEDAKACYVEKTTTSGGGKTYANTSEALKVTSKSSADVKLTVEVTAASGAKDITLVDAAPGKDVTDPQLYLALNVGSTTKAIKKGETTKAEVTIAGKNDNFETIVKDNAYVYAEKEVADGDPALTWNEESISLSGAVSKASAKDLTAPTLTVTWKYEDPAATPADAAPDISQTTYTMAADTAVTINVDLGAGDLAAEGVASIKWGSVDLISRNYASYADGVVTINANCVNILRGKDGSQTVEITFNDDAATVKNVTLSK